MPKLSTETCSGRLLYPETFSVDMIYLPDIIHSLKHICRFNGHCKHFFSVLTHSVNCCIVAKRLNYDFETCKWCLGHDFSEMVLGDIPRPFRPLLPDFNALEEKIDLVFEERFNFRGDYKLMRSIDMSICKFEARWLMKSKGNWEGDFLDLKVKRSDLYGLESEVDSVAIVSVFKKLCREFKLK